MCEMTDLEKEIKWRNIHNISATMPRQEFIMAARGIAKKEFMLVAVSMATTLTIDMNMPPSIVKDFLKIFNDKIDLYRDNEEQFEKDATTLNKCITYQKIVVLTLGKRFWLSLNLLT